MHIVTVGYLGNFQFNPEVVYASIGDTISFEFFPSNHSIVRGEYFKSQACRDGSCNPCIPYELIHPGKEGFNSGNIISQATENVCYKIIRLILIAKVPTFNITIEDNSPIWFYCTALGSCHPNGMVGTINPGKGESIIKQKQAAANAPFQLLPGQDWPAEEAQPTFGYEP